ncbi:hypothetical protein [Granulicella sp. L46]|uniref:hypothetical protein n=1 Tax=Granulicella sp. L46 TaxID=1641865 RepID=UPI00131D7341|nr:hypothetical protein [Granulicella sp. L46]
MKKTMMVAFLALATLASASAQVTSFGSFTSSSTSGSQFHLGGTSEREGVGSVVLNDQLYVAYTGSNGTEYLTSATTGVGYSLLAGTQVQINGGTFASDNNPALATDGTYLFLAYMDTSGHFNLLRSPANPYGTTFTWTAVGTFDPPSESFIYSPSLAVMSVGGVSTLFMSGVGSDRSLWLGQYPIGGSWTSASWTNTTGTDIGMSPGLGVFNGTLYIAFPTNGNSHDIYYYTTTGNGVLTYNTGADGDSSSTSISVLAYQGYLYFAFRTNDGDHKFIIKHSSNGTSWSGSKSFSDAMAGPPSLADGTTLTGDPGHLICNYVGNNSSYYLFGGESD